MNIEDSTWHIAQQGSPCLGEALMRQGANCSPPWQGRAEVLRGQPVTSTMYFVLVLLLWQHAEPARWVSGAPVCVGAHVHGGVTECPCQEGAAGAPVPQGEAEWGGLQSSETVAVTQGLISHEREAVQLVVITLWGRWLPPKLARWGSVNQNDM